MLNQPLRVQWGAQSALLQLVGNRQVIFLSAHLAAASGPLLLLPQAETPPVSPV